MNSAKKWLLPIAAIIFCGICIWQIDLPLAVFFNSIAGIWPIRFFEIITDAGDSVWTLAPSLIITLVFWKLKRQIALQSLFMFASVAGSGIAVNILKITICRYRPVKFFENGLYGFDFFAFAIDFGRNSFPSGHSATAISATVALGLIFPRFRILFWSAGALVAFCRAAICKHYLGDVIAGGLIGAYWAVLMWKLVAKRFTHNALQ
ncbi:phosphatase PAP2 family protein [Ignavibacteria bacterium]